MEVLGLAKNDLLPYFGNKGNVSNVLNGKRPLSLQNIRVLRKELHLSGEILLEEIKITNNTISAMAVE